MFKKAADLLEYLERKGISIPNFAKQSGVSANRLHLWKAGRGNPKSDDTVLIQQWYEKHVVNDIKEDKEVHTIDKNTTAKDSEVLRLLTLTEKITDSHLGLVRSHENLTIDHHKIINQNEYLTKVLEKDIGQKINLNSTPKNLQENEIFARHVAEFLANKYSLNENDVLSDVGSIVLSFRSSIKS